MQTTELSASKQQARWVAAYGMPEVGPPPPLRVSPADTTGFIGEVSNQRITGLALAAIRDELLEVPQDAMETLRERHREAMTQALALERQMLDMTEALEAANVPAVIVKGPVLAYGFYPDPSWRSFGDIDLLIRGRDWRRALATLADLGLERQIPEPRPGFDERFGKGATHTSDGGFEADVHRTLAPGPFGLWMEPDELIDRAEWFQVGGIPLRRLDDTGVFLHACLHASLGMRVPMYSPVRDVVQVAALGKLDWSVLEDWADRWRMRPVFQHSFLSAAAMLGAPWPVEARRLLTGPSGRTERRVLAAYTTALRGRGGTARTTLKAIKGLRAKAAYVRMLLFPSQEFLAWRAGENRRPSYVRRWMIPVRWLIGRKA